MQGSVDFLFLVLFLIYPTNTWQLSFIVIHFYLFIFIFLLVDKQAFTSGLLGIRSTERKRSCARLGWSDPQACALLPSKGMNEKRVKSLLGILNRFTLLPPERLGSGFDRAVIHSLSSGEILWTSGLDSTCMPTWKDTEAPGTQTYTAVAGTPTSAQARILSEAEFSKND